MTKAKTEVHLFINAYVDPNPERNAELVECIKQNIANKSIDKVWLLCDVDYPDKYKGATNLYEFDRPTFRDFFAWANELCNEGDIAIIANTDVYFDETIAFVHDIQNHECFALSRYDVQYDGSLKPFHRQDSQDAWIMRTPIKPIEARFTMGVGGCDNVLAYQLNEAGYKLTNPCSKIRAIHLHLTNLRRYTEKDRLKPPYKMVIPK